jgi:hypothetical protein
MIVVQAFNAFFPTLFQSRSVYFDHPGDLSHYLKDGLLDTDGIAADAASGCSFQRKLLEASCTRPEELIREQGFWPSELFELSALAMSRSGEHHFDVWLVKLIRDSRRTPLIHLCLLSMGVPNEQYERRIGKVIDSIVQKMSYSELHILRLLVFAALFAPGIRLETSLAANLARDAETKSPVSPSLAALVQTGILEDDSRLHPVMSIPSPRLAMILAKHSKVFNADGSEAPASLARYVTGELFDWVRSSIEVRVMLEPLFVRAFCRMRIWHWTPRLDNTKKGGLSFSFLVELLFHCNRGLHKGVAWKDAKAAVADVFESIAKLFTDSTYLLWTEDGDEAGLVRRLDAAVQLSTHASRYIESYAKPWAPLGSTPFLPTHDARTVQYDRAVRLLSFPGASGKRDVLLRLATIDRRRLDSYFAEVVAEKRNDQWPRPRDLEDIMSMFSQAKNRYIHLIRDTQKSYPHPLIGIVQLYLALLEHLLGRFRATSVDKLLHTLDNAAKPGPELRQSIQTYAAGSNVFDEIRDYLIESHYAAKYVKLAMDRERTQELTRSLRVRLHDLAGGSDANPVDKAIFILNERDKVRAMSFDDLCVHLNIVADHLFGRLGRATVQLTMTGVSADYTPAKLELVKADLATPASISLSAISLKVEAEEAGVVVLAMMPAAAAAEVVSKFASKAFTTLASQQVRAFPGSILLVR